MRSTFHVISFRMRGILWAIATLLILPSPASTYASQQEKADAIGPTIKVVSPASGVANLIAAGSEAKVLVVIEIADRSGAGLDADDSGTPKFVESDDNVALFRRHIIKKSEYTNHLGQVVTQLVSEVPLRELKFDPGSKLTPPVDAQSPTVRGRTKGFMIPPEAMNDVAVFVFRVQDRTGALSPMKQEDSRLLIGVGWTIFTPPPETEADPDPSKAAPGAASSGKPGA